MMQLNPYATIIAYMDGLAICEDDFGDLWYAEIPESCAEPGTVLEIEILRELKTLPNAQQTDILREIAANKEVP